MKSNFIYLTNLNWRLSKSKDRTTYKESLKNFHIIYLLFVEKELRSLQRKKLEIPPNLLKDCASVISKSLAHINVSIRANIDF